MSSALKPAARRKRRTRQIARSDETRGKLLAAAERAFAKDGLAGARTDAIAKDAGVNKALLYYHFRSKERLYEAVIEEQLREFNERAMGLLHETGSPRTILLKYVNLHFDFIARRHRHAALFQQLIMKRGKPPERLFQQYIRPRGEALQQLLVRGMQAGEFRQGDPLHTAISLVGLVVFYFSAAPMLQMMGGPDPYAAASLQARKHEVLQFIRHGLLTHPDAVLT